MDLINQFCTLDPFESTEGCNYIDLIKNEEKYTGYQVKKNTLFLFHLEVISETKDDALLGDFFCR